MSDLQDEFAIRDDLLGSDADLGPTDRDPIAESDDEPTSIEESEDDEDKGEEFSERDLAEISRVIPRFRAPFAPRFHKKPRPKPTPRPEPPEGLSTSDTVTWWIDELTDLIDYLRALDLSFKKFARPLADEDGGYLTIFPNHLPKRFRDRYQRDAHTPQSVQEEVDHAAESLARAIRADSPKVGAARFAKFVDARDGRTWLAPPDDCLFEPEKCTFDLIDLEDDPIAWSCDIVHVAVFQPGQRLRFKCEWIWPQSDDLFYAIDDDGTATIVEAGG